MAQNTKKILHEWVEETPTIKIDPSVDITYSPECGYGLQLRNFHGTLKEEEPILSLSDNLVFCASHIRELASKDKTLHNWISLGSLSDNDILHRGLLYYWLFGESKWKPYLDSLPTDLDLPFNYSIKKMEGLDFSTVSLYSPALSKRLEIERGYERFLNSEVEHSSSISLKQWLLPYQWISSRGLTHPKTNEVCIVPLVDLCNHSTYESNVRYDIDEDGNFQLLLLPLAPGELRSDKYKGEAESNHTFDLLLNYGMRSTSEFMFNYGFIPQDRSEEDFDEIVKFFDPGCEEIRAVLDPGESTQSASDDERFAWSLAYDLLVEFFSDIPQKLRIIVLPESVEPDQTKRFRFHSDFIMALASDEHLELITENDKEELYLNDVKLEPDTAFQTVLSLGDPSITMKARKLVSKLCQMFYDDLMKVSDSDVTVSTLAKVEASIYKRYADAVNMEETSNSSRADQDSGNSHESKSRDPASELAKLQISQPEEPNPEGSKQSDSESKKEMDSKPNENSDLKSD